MVLKLLVAGTAFLFSACLNGVDDDQGASPTPWAGNVQEWYFLSSISGNALQRTEEPCDEQVDYAPVRYRLRGDTLDLGFPNYTVVWNDAGDGSFVASDTLWFGGTYVRRAGANGSVIGSWGFVDHRPWDAISAQDERLDSVAEEWNFLYAGEEVTITSRAMAFSYPNLRLYSIRRAQHNLQDDPGVTFQYVGWDSVRITRAGETASIRHHPFHSIYARSTNADRPLINESLDSCTFPNRVVDTTWISDVIWGEEDDFSAVILPEKRGASESRARRPGRGR